MGEGGLCVSKGRVRGMRASSIFKTELTSCPPSTDFRLRETHLLPQSGRRTRKKRRSFRPAVFHKPIIYININQTNVGLLCLPDLPTAVKSPRSSGVSGAMSKPHLPRSNLPRSSFHWQIGWCVLKLL